METTQSGEEELRRKFILLTPLGIWGVLSLQLALLELLLKSSLGLGHHFWSWEDNWSPEERSKG